MILGTAMTVAGFVALYLSWIPPLTGYYNQQDDNQSRWERNLFSIVMWSVFLLVQGGVYFMVRYYASPDIANTLFVLQAMWIVNWSASRRNGWQWEKTLSGLLFLCFFIILILEIGELWL